MGPAQLRAPGPPRYATRGNWSVFRPRQGKGKTLPDEGLMCDSHAIDAERGVQPRFINAAAGLDAAKRTQRRAPRPDCEVENAGR